MIHFQQLFPNSERLDHILRCNNSHSLQHILTFAVALIGSIRKFLIHIKKITVLSITFGDTEE